MKTRNTRLFSFAAAVFVASMMAALPASAASRGGGSRGGFHGSRGGHGGTRIIIGGSWGWGYPYWGGWYGPGYYGYYGYGGYGRGYAPADSNWGAVKTDVSPEDARVYLDGKYIGVADDFDGWPDKLYLRPGHYKLEFRLSGYDTKSVDVTSRPGRTLEIDDKLPRNPGVRSSDPPKMEGDVQRYFGKRDRDGARSYARREEPRGDADSDMDADDDSPEYRADRDRDRDADRDRDRDNDSWRGQSRRPDSSVTARPVRADRSRLRIAVEPSDAVVYLDNRFVGSAEEVSSMDRGIVVSPGKHTVTVSRPGFKDRTTEVTVDPGKTEKIEVSLSR